MNKRDKAMALAARHEMVEKGVTFSQIMRFATTREVHGYWKGVFCPTGQPANLYSLIHAVKERMEAGVPMRRRRRNVTSVRPLRPKAKPSVTQGFLVFPGELQRALAH